MVYRLKIDKHKHMCYNKGRLRGGLYMVKNSDNIERSPYVRDYDYDNVGDGNGKNRFSDISELEQYLDKVFIPKNISYKKIKGKSFDEEKCLSIQFNRILSLKCSNEEVKYIIQYLSDRDIHVGGFVSTLEGEFDNYDYKHTYNLSPYPSCMSYEEQKILFEKLALYKKLNDDRKNEVVKKIAEGTLRLIPYVTYKYALFSGIDINELNGYGCEGLMIAIDRFDPSLGYRFSTFAYPHIKNRVNDGLRNIRGFKNDRNFYGSFIKCKDAIENGYSEDVGVEMTLSDNPSMLYDIINLMKDTCALSPKRETILRNKLYMLYHDSYESCTDLVFDFDMEEKVMKKEQIDLLWKMLNSLPDKERDVIFKRFGFDGENIMTLEEIGNLYGVSRERVRQIEKKAISRFKSEDGLK